MDTKLERMLANQFHIGDCPTCGKNRFRTRKAARRFIKARHQGEQMYVYSCGEFFHIGHKIQAVVRGESTRRRESRRIEKKRDGNRNDDQEVA